MDPKYFQRLLETDIRVELAHSLVSSITTSPPFVSVPGIFNIRTIRPGIYRSGALPTTLTPEAETALIQDLCITTIFDLRRPKERTNEPSPAIAGVTTTWVPYAFDPPPLDYADFADGDCGESLARMYRSCLDTHVPIYKRVFEHIRDHPRCGILFHCSAGKDRTGVLAALILRMAGCSDEAIVHDYMLTRVGIEAARPALKTMLKAHHGLEGDDLQHRGMVNLLGVQVEGMVGFLEKLDEIGGAVGYLRRRLGISERDVDVIRRNLSMALE